MFGVPTSERAGAGHRGRRHPQGRLHRRALRAPRPHGAGHPGSVPSRRAGHHARRQQRSRRPARRPHRRRLPPVGPRGLGLLPRRGADSSGAPIPGPAPSARTRRSCSPRTSSAGGSRSGRTSSTRPTPTATWLAQNDGDGPYRAVAGIDELRAQGQYRVLTPDEHVAELEAAPFPFALLPPAVRRDPARARLDQPPALRARRDAGVRVMPVT